jgi:hypothetical protein
MRTTVNILACCIVMVLCGFLWAATSDPSPRFELLGVETLAGNHTGQPAKVFVYKDKALNNEVLCFAGEMRETLSCFESGRLR